MIVQNEVKQIIAQSHISIVQGGLKYKLNSVACTIIPYQNEPKQSNANHNDQAARKANI